MPISSVFADVEIPPVDIWSLYMEMEKPYPDSHRKSQPPSLILFPQRRKPMISKPKEEKNVNNMRQPEYETANIHMKALLIDSVTGRSYNRAQMKELSIQFGQGLKHELGWSKGDVLAFFTPNNIDTPVVNLGLHWAGGVASPANPTYTVDELARQLKDSGAKALVTQTPFLDASIQAAEKVGLPKESIILLGDGRHSKFRHWSEITAKGAWLAPRRPQVGPSDVAYLVYSSVSLYFAPVLSSNQKEEDMRKRERKNRMISK